MRKSRFTESQIVGVLKELKAGVKADTLCRKHGISGATLYNWRSKYGGLEVSDLRRLKELEDENRRLKKIVADQVLNIEALKMVAEGAFQGPYSARARCGPYRNAGKSRNELRAAGSTSIASIRYETI
jgi:putative transposase